MTIMDKLDDYFTEKYYTALLRAYEWTDKRHELEKRYPVLIDIETVIVIAGPYIALGIWILLTI